MFQNNYMYFSLINLCKNVDKREMLVQVKVLDSKQF